MPRGTEVLCCIVMMVSIVCSAASLTEQRRELSRAATAMRVAERMANAKRYDEAAESIADAQQALSKAGEGLDKRLKTSFERTLDRLKKTHSDLTKAGVKLAPLGDLSPTAALPQPTLGGDAPFAPGTEISFVKQVVPILNKHCGGCHVRGTRGGVSFASYNALKGSGQIVVGAGSESNLIEVIVSGSMPPNGNVVSPQEVRLLMSWITKGAKFDGDSQNKPLGQLVLATEAPAEPTEEMLAAAAEAEAVKFLEESKPEEISADRQKQAEQMWKLAIPDEAASQRTTERFLVIGNVPGAALDRVGQAAESQADAILATFPKLNESLNRGRWTIVALSKRIDYSEFGTMVERRELPFGQTSHAKYQTTNPYVAMRYTDDDAALKRIIATDLATLWIARQGQGRLPEWFTAGAGRAIAARIHKSDPTVRGWQAELPAAISAQPKSDDFMTGKVSPESGKLISYGFVDALMRKPGNFVRLVQATAESDFDQACQEVFRQTPTDLAKMWVASQKSRR